MTGVILNEMHVAIVAESFTDVLEKILFSILTNHQLINLFLDIISKLIKF